MSKNTIVLNNRDEFIKFTEDRVLREFAKVFIGNKKYHLENMMEAIRFYVSFKTVNTPKESSFPIVFKIDEYNSMLVVGGANKYPLHRGNKFINNEFEEFMNTICDNLEYDGEKGLIKTVSALEYIFEVETFFCYERMNKPKPKLSATTVSPDVMEIVGTTPKGEKVVPNDPFKVVVKDKTITVKVSKGYVVNVESM